MMRSRFTVGVLASLITSVTSLAADLDDAYGAAYEPLRAELLPDTHALPRGCRQSRHRDRTRSS